MPRAHGAYWYGGSVMSFSGRSMPWLRLYHDIIDDEKIRMLAFEDRWHYIAILCCKRKGILDSGSDPTLLDRKLAVKLGVQLRELDEIKRRLVEVELIDSAWQPLGWDQHQFRSDQDSTGAERQRRFRQRKKEGNA